MQEMRETLVQSLGQEKGMVTHSSILRYSCLENPMDRGAWHGSQGHKESDMTKGI